MTMNNEQANHLLEVTNLKKHFPIRAGMFRRVVGQVKAVDGVSFFIDKGETFGLVGESGCGKTTTGRTILRLLEPTDGQVVYVRDGKRININQLGAEEMRQMRRHMQIVFQDPYSSLNPRMTLKQIVGEPLIVNKIARGDELTDRVAALLRAVGLRPEYLDRYPHAFSGGQRQRIGIARALALNPELIICDEPVSALDVSIQAQALNLLAELQAHFDLTYLFIAHDLSVVRHISDRVAVMYVGKLVEMAPTEQLYMEPKHPYTEALMTAVPIPDPREQRKREILEGEVANPADPPSGCYFHPRCKYAQDICKTDEPPIRKIGDGHLVSCHFADQFQLRGVGGE